MLPAYFSTFPVNGKKPLIDWKEFQERLATEEEANAWNKRYPSHGLGVVCGPISRIFVLDVDGPAGRASLEKLEATYGELPRTPTQTTPRADGGQHFFFRWVDELDERVTTTTDLLDYAKQGEAVCGLDTRGAGGFVVFYGWDVSPLAVPFAYPPDWLINLLPRKAGVAAGAKEQPPMVVSVPPVQLGVQLASAPGSKAWLSEKLSSLREGNRNQTFTSIAGRLRRDGYKPEELYALLSSKAREVRFPEQELRTLCESVGRYKTATENNGEDDIVSLIQNSKPVEWICDQIIAKQSITIFDGLPKVQKTWLVQDLLLEAAIGGSWLNKFPIKQSRVVFIDQERPKDETLRRFKALIKGKGLEPEDIRDSLLLRLRSTIRVDMQNSFDAFRKYLGEKQPDIVAVDSLGTFHVKEETNNSEMQAVMEQIKALRDEFGCSFVFIHHDHKGSFQAAREGQAPSILDMRGAIAIPAAAEHVFNVKRQDPQTCWLYHTANNLGELIPPLLTRITDLVPDKSAIKVDCH